MQAEQGRILRGLHDTVKQDIHGASMMVEAAVVAQRRGDAGAAGQILEKALEAAWEVQRDLSKPLDELRAAAGHDTQAPTAFLRERLGRIERLYGIRTHEDLRATLEELGPEEVVVAQQILRRSLLERRQTLGRKNFRLLTCWEDQRPSCWRWRTTGTVTDQRRRRRDWGRA